MNLCSFQLSPKRALPPMQGVLLFLTLFLLSSEPVHAFGKKPVVVTPPSTPTEPSVPVTGDVIRARWEPKNRDGAAWSQHVFDVLPTLAPNLLAKTPADIANFCPAYGDLSAADKRNFWVYLLSGMTELESNHDTSVTYTENFYDNHGRRVVSRGLLQISIESGNAYGCAFQTESELHDPVRNLDCGLRILNKWIGADGRISGKSSSWLGGARYWAVLRTPKVSQIQGWTKALRMCGQ